MHFRTSFARSAALVLAANLAGCAGSDNPVAISLDRELGAATLGSLNRSLPDRSEGDVLLMLAPNGQDVLVALDLSRFGTPDGTADRVFTLMRDSLDAGTRLMAPEGMHLAGATVLESPQGLVIQHSRLSAKLSLRSEAPPQATENSVRGGTLHWAGYGISRSNGAWPMEASALAEASRQGFCNTAAAAPGSSAEGEVIALNIKPECAAGGSGASGCSIETMSFSCSTNCNTGYYACCNVLGGCKCMVGS
jgi:hypothetical protein